MFKTTRRFFGLFLMSLLPMGGYETLHAQQASSPAASSPAASSQVFWIGGYGPGIYASRLNSDGSMVEPRLVAKQSKASFFAMHPTLDVLYVVTETAINDQERAASLAAYQFDRAAYQAVDLSDEKSLQLKLLNVQRVGGDGPCHVTVDPAGQFAVVSNYGSGSVCLFPIRADGSLEPESSMVKHQGSGPNAARQKGPHAHCAMVDPTNRWVLVADLGLDQVLVYRLDGASKKLIPGPTPFFKLAGGSGPRHLAFHPEGKLVYIINEMGMTLTSAAWDSETGTLTQIATVGSVPEETLQASWSTAEVLVHPSGRFVYGSNRGHNTIALFAISPKDGGAVRVENFSTLGNTPRNFRIDPTGQFLLAENQDSNTVHSFSIDRGTGFLKPTGHSITAQKPACIKFMVPRSAP
ncbi:MAG: lactonase family protein [Planctomycetota bacterium]|nr:lactonase family protein [Planctomycetota bacterium]